MLVPPYYREFKCKAGDCRDSCCIGWELDIDESSYQRYLHLKMSFFCMSEEERVQDDYYLDYMLYYAHRTYTFDLSDYIEIEEENRDLLDEYQDEIHACLIGLFHLTEEEFTEIMSVDYLNSNERDSFTMKVRERNDW